MDSNTDKDYTPIIAAIIVGGLLIFIYKILFTKSSSEDKGENEDRLEEKSNGTKQASHKKSQKSIPFSKKNKKTQSNFTDPLLHTTLKGHGGNILGLDTSINGKYLASCSEDRTVRLWSVKDFGKGNQSFRVNVELDHAKHARFSPDSRAFIAGLAIDNTVRVFKLSKKEDNTPTATPVEPDFPKYNKADILNVGVGSSASGGSFVMTAYKDTTIIVRDIKGEPLHTINTNQGNNNHAAVSPCGRFVASSGWTPGVKVWAVKFLRNGDFHEVVRAFELKGHTSSVWSFAFNFDSTRMVSVSKDRTWRYYDTQVEYDKGQEPYLISSGEFNVCGLSPTENSCLAALSPDGRVVAVACANNVCTFSTATGKIENEFKEVHIELITAITFDIAGRFILTSGDRHIRVFHNVLGFKETIRELEEKIRSLPAASATRDRLRKQIEASKASLAAILSNNE